MKKKKLHYRIFDGLTRKTNLAQWSSMSCQQLQNMPYEMRLPGYPVPNIRPMSETLDLLEQGKSLCRFGDGEFNLIFQKKMLYEAPGAEISGRLLEVLRTKRDNVLIGIPGSLADMSTLNNRQKAWWLGYYYENRFGINQILDFSKEYHCANISRFYMNSMYRNPDDLAEHYHRLIEIFKNKKCVLVGAEHKAKKHDFYRLINIVDYVTTPATGAYALYDQLLAQISGYDASHTIMLALGPTATVLAHDLAARGFQALDIGHIALDYHNYMTVLSENPHLLYDSEYCPDLHIE